MSCTVPDRHRSGSFALSLALLAAVSSGKMQKEREHQLVFPLLIYGSFRRVRSDVRHPVAPFDLYIQFLFQLLIFRNQLIIVAALHIVLHKAEGRLLHLLL